MTFEIALTGINAAATELDAIGNNIANNATSGFKRSSVNFADVFALSAGSDNSATGSGVRVASVRQGFGQGDLKFTSRNLDLAVEGLGMFRLENNGSAAYTRSGNFGLDREGFIVDAQGRNLTGYGVNKRNEVEPITTKLKIDYSDMQPSPSSEVELQMNMDITAEVLPPFDVTDTDTFNFSTSLTVYDSLGDSQVANLYFRKDAPNAWTTYTFVDGNEISQVGGDEITFGTDGILATVNGSAATTYTTNTFNPASAAEPMQLTFDVSAMTQYDNTFGVNKISQNGFSAGRLEGFEVDNSGVIFGNFTNGQTRTMGQVTLTNFPNQGGLKQAGSTTWVETFTSGAAATGAPGSASLGTLKAGALEGSNVDITQELVAMIGAQRSFQANAQVISTSDTLAQTVINMRR